MANYLFVAGEGLWEGSDDHMFLGFCWECRVGSGLDDSGVGIVDKSQLAGRSADVLSVWSHDGRERKIYYNTGQ
jgi:hypothetical protein